MLVMCFGTVQMLHNYQKTAFSKLESQVLGLKKWQTEVRQRSWGTGTRASSREHICGSAGCPGTPQSFQEGYHRDIDSKRENGTRLVELFGRNKCQDFFFRTDPRTILAEKAIEMLKRHHFMRSSSFHYYENLNALRSTSLLNATIIKYVFWYQAEIFLSHVTTLKGLLLTCLNSGCSSETQTSKRVLEALCLCLFYFVTYIPLNSCCTFTSSQFCHCSIFFQVLLHGKIRQVLHPWNWNCTFIFSF